jgi:nucleotide-binding universal stress UspA family protein
MYTHILVATDGSALSQKAERHAIALAKMSGATLMALTVVPTYPQSYYEGSLPVNSDEVARTEAEWEKAAQITVQGVKDAALAEGIRAQAMTVRSDWVAETVIATAQQHQVDLIVMASHGHKGLKRILLGSETQHVLTHSHIPVLVLR